MGGDSEAFCLRNRTERREEETGEKGEEKREERRERIRETRDTEYRSCHGIIGYFVVNSYIVILRSTIPTFKDNPKILNFQRSRPRARHYKNPTNKHLRPNYIHISMHI